MGVSGDPTNVRSHWQWVWSTWNARSSSRLQPALTVMLALMGTQGRGWRTLRSVRRGSANPTGLVSVQQALNPSGLFCDPLGPYCDPPPFLSPQASVGSWCGSASPTRGSRRSQQCCQTWGVRGRALRGTLRMVGPNGTPFPTLSPFYLLPPFLSPSPFFIFLLSIILFLHLPFPAHLQGCGGATKLCWWHRNSPRSFLGGGCSLLGGCCRDSR